MKLSKDWLSAAFSFKFLICLELRNVGLYALINFEFEVVEEVFVFVILLKNVSKSN